MKKKTLLTKFLLFALVMGGLSNASFAQNDADPAITSFSFAMSPVVQNNTTTLTLFFLNNGTTTAIPANTFQVQISLPNTDVNPPITFGPQYKAFPEDNTNPSGTFASKFNWSYNAATHAYLGTNNAIIGPGDGGTIVITVKGYVVDINQVPSTARIVKTSPANYPNEDNNNNNLSAGLAVGAGGVVSVGLLDFTASGKDNRTVSLDWQTTSEQNSKYFDVEWSADGVSFSPIGQVTAAGNSTTARTYNLIHAKPINGINYYRLKQVDGDGSFKYSVIRKVKFGAASVLYVMPNPTHDRIRIISGAGGKVETISIYSAEGRNMRVINNYNYGGTIDVSGFAPGTYVIRLADKDGSTELLKFIKN